MQNFIGIEAWEDSLKSGELKCREKEKKNNKKEKEEKKPILGSF